MLRAGSLEPKWPNALFTLLPKFGGNSKPNSWKPIAILIVTYKKCSKIIYVQLRNTAEAHQGIDQTGFWPGTGLEDAFFFEAMCGKCLEWNAPHWCASFDSTKTFDRIEYEPFFTALLGQGVPESYCVFFWTLYCQQICP